MATLVLEFFTLVLLFRAGAGDQYPQRQRHGQINVGSKLYAHDTSYWPSPSGIFAFGFYKKAGGFAVGIWLQTHSTPDPIVTWTANRDDPPLSSDAWLEFTEEGKLLVWTKESPNGFIGIVYYLPQPATSASLLDSGSFVLYYESDVIWDSFDYPTDTILGGQYLRLGESLISSVSVSDKSKGRFKLVLQEDGNLVAYPVNSTGAPDESYWSTGVIADSSAQILGLTETGNLFLGYHYGIGQGHTQEIGPGHTIAWGLNLSESSMTKIYRAILDSDGNFRLYLHIIDSISNSSVMTLWSALTHNDPCRIKGYCGLNSYCSFNASTGNPSCVCFPGFVYKDLEKNFLGCYRNFSYERYCGIRQDNSSASKYNFTPITNMEIGGYPYGRIQMVQGECLESCMNDCNCWAVLYASGTCSKYKPPLQYAIQDQKHLAIAFIKQSHNSWEAEVADKHKRRMVLILAPSFGFVSFLFTLLAVLSFSLFRRRAVKYKKLLEMENFGPNKEFTLRSISYNELEKATNGFNEEAGSITYGKIYEGIISEGNRKVSVKRLEKFNDDGEREFIAEMAAMGRIHHKNVVRLVGFCFEGTKKILVYESMKNISLAAILYGVETRPFWKQGMKLALDVAEGILYLHQECDTHIVHCNIRPENILVGDNWTAKISDFSSAKLLMPNQKENLALERQRRGYLAPEWRKKASVSEKVDVYSYGVVLLEIICCNSSEEINVQSPDNDFPMRVYSYFKANELRKLVGNEEVDMVSMERMVKVGLSCVQIDPDLRPSMKNVILMLEGSMDTPVPVFPILD